MWQITVPTVVNLSAKRTFSLNLNQYRNADFHTLNNAKQKFKEVVAPEFKILSKMKSCKLVFTFFSGSKRKSDTSNICSIVEKFFNDALVEEGYLEDDNYEFVLESIYRYGGYIKGDNHVVVDIIPIEMESEPMKITLEREEVEAALLIAAQQRVVLKPDEEVSVDLQSTRGSPGFTAEITISKKADKPAASKTAEPAKVVQQAEVEIAESQHEEDNNTIQAEPAEEQQEVATEAPARPLFGRKPQ